MGMSHVVEREKKCEAADGAWVGLTRMILRARDTWLAMGCSNIMVLFNFIISRAKPRGPSSIIHR